MAKKRIVKDYSALPEDIIRLVKIKYPTGYADHLVSYNDATGKKVSALPFETDEVYYLIRMTILEAKRIVKNDEDFDEDGVLREGFALEDVEVGEEFTGDGEEDDEMADGSSDEDDHIIVTKRRDDEEDIADDTEY